MLPDKASDLTSRLTGVVSGQTKGRTPTRRLQPFSGSGFDACSSALILTQDIVSLASQHHNQSVFLPSPYRNSDSKQNQIHALLTPNNMVGGAHCVNHTYVPGGVPNHPVEGIVGEIY